MLGIHTKHDYMIFVKNCNGYYTLIFHWGCCHVFYVISRHVTAKLRFQKYW